MRTSVQFQRETFINFKLLTYTLCWTWYVTYRMWHVSLKFHFVEYFIEYIKKIEITTINIIGTVLQVHPKDFRVC